MQSVSDTIQAIARQRGRGDAGPLIALRQLDGSAGERVSHLPVERDLAQAWPAMTGEPFRPHQAQALAALRRGDAVALRASSADVATSSFLLTYAALTDERFATALLLAPDDEEALAIHDRLVQINESLPASLRLSTTLVVPKTRPDPYARVVVTTPEVLHGRLLRHHDRAWRLFWPALRLIALPDIQRYVGVAGAHLADLLMRATRVVAGHGGAGAAILATLTEVAEPDPALTSMLGHPWRVIGADDDQQGAPLLAIWHGGGARLRESAELALALNRQGYRVHVSCGALERAAITPVIGDAEGITIGRGTLPAQVVISVGYRGSTSGVRRLLRSGYQAVVVVLGDLPHEHAVARHVESLVSGPPAAWPPPPANAYVTAQHVLCAASELPLTGTEVQAWGATDVVERLAAHQQLVDLPDPEVSWKPAEAAGDPYADFTLMAASGAPISARTEQGVAVGVFDPTGFERWTFPGAALPPGAGGMRVVTRDDDSGTISVRVETSGRRTYPLRRCSVEVREARETRQLAGGRQVSWGRVVVSEEIYGYREGGGAQAAADMALKAPLSTRWVAPACWFDVGIELQALGQFIGWSLAATLPLRTLASFTDVVPVYDNEARRLYLVDAQPGGSGLATWVYARAEELLPLAYDVALACRTDPLLEPLSRVDQDWLLALLGRSEPGQSDRRTPAPARPEAPLRTPAPAPPQRAPAPQERPAPVAEVFPELPAPPAERPAPLADAPPRWQPVREPVPEQRPPAREPVPERRPAPEPVREQRPPAPERRPAPEPAREQRPPAREPAPERRPAPEPAREQRPPERPAAPQPVNGQLWDEPEEAPWPAPERAAPPARPAPEPQARPQQPPARRTPEAPAEDAMPDANALIERLRRQRQQREGAAQARRAQPETKGGASAVVRRFSPGDRIFCLPYGDGEVQDSFVDSGRELLTVQFPDHGELEIDPAVSLVRKLESDQAPEDDLL